MKKWCYSHNGEGYSGEYDTREEAIVDAKDYFPDQDEIYVGNAVECEICIPDLADDVIEVIMEDLYEQCGEASEHFEVDYNQQEELMRRLDEAIKNWIKDCKIKSNCYKVVNSKRVKIKE